MTLPFIDVVVPTFNRALMLEPVIASLVDQNYPAERYRVIVVDDGSTDGTWPALQKWTGRCSRISALRIVHAGSYAARNSGWQKGFGDIVAFTDDDCVADREWLAAIARSFADHPEALGVQGKTITLPRLVTPMTHQVVVRGPNTIYHTCNVAYKRTALTAVGGFDEQVAHYSGDSQLGAAVSSLGPIIFELRMVVIHPPRPRNFLGREEWNRRVEESLRFYCRYPDFYRRNRGPHFLLVVILRWALGSTIKNIIAQFPWLVRDPALYFKFLIALLKERTVLLLMLPGFWRGHRRWVKTVERADIKAPVKSVGAAK